MIIIKALKMMVAIFVVSFLTGCSDQTTSSSGVSEEQVMERQDGFLLGSYNTQIRLKPFRSYTFSVSNTELSQFNSIKVVNLWDDPDIDGRPIECQYLNIYGDSKDAVSLNCKTKGLDLKTITIENTGPKMLDLNVTLYGVKTKKSN